MIETRVTIDTLIARAIKNFVVISSVDHTLTIHMRGVGEEQLTRLRQFAADLGQAIADAEKYAEAEEKDLTTF